MILEQLKTLQAIERERKKIVKNKVMLKEVKQRIFIIFDEATKRIKTNKGLMVLLNDSPIFQGGNCEVIAEQLGKITKSQNTFECETGDRRNFIFIEVKAR